MDFLVDTHVRLPDDVDAQRRRDLLAAELEQGRALKAAGSSSAVSIAWPSGVDVLARGDAASPSRRRGET
jgi:muconolactone delta-isomerase